MSYDKKLGTAKEYQGESFALSLFKKTKDTWFKNESGVFEVTDNLGVVVISGTMVKSIDSLSFTIILGKTDTAALEGKYLLLGYQRDSDNAEINDVIAEYNITYSSKKAL